MKRFIWCLCVSLIGVSSVPAEELRLRVTLQGHKGEVYSVAFSPDGKTLASGSDDETIRLWDVASAKNTRTLTLSPNPRPPVPLPPGEYPKGDADAGEWCVRAVAFSPDGKILASAHPGRAAVVLWDMTSGKAIATLHHERHLRPGDIPFPTSVESVAFSPDGRVVASVPGDDTVRLWDVASRKQIRMLQSDDGVMSVAFSLDGAMLASGGGRPRVTLWDVASGKRVATLEVDEENIRSVAFSPDGRTLASAGVEETIRLWDVATRTTRATLHAPEPETLFDFHACRALAFSKNGGLLAWGDVTGAVMLWDIGSGRLLATAKCYRELAEYSEVTPDRNGIKVKLGVENVTPDQSFPDKGHAGLVNSVAFSPDGKTLASGGHDKSVKLWDIVAKKKADARP